MRAKPIVKRHFTLLGISPNKKITQYSCNHCKKKYALNVTRMVKHLKTACKNCPKKIKNLLRSPKTTSHRKKRALLQSSSSETSHNSSTSFVVEDVEAAEKSNDGNEAGNGQSIQEDKNDKSIPLSQKKIQQSASIKEFCDKITKSEEKRLRNLLALAIFASGTPLSITENVYWQEFFAAARPSWKLPSRYDISTSLLDESFEKVRNNVEEKVAFAPTVGIQCDGWSNIRNEGVINFIVTTPEPVFFQTIPTETHAETAEFIAEKMSEVIEKIGPKKVLGVCTDNAASMKRAWKILDEQYAGEKIAFYGCVAHILNLLIKDIANQPAVMRLVKNATAIVKETKGGHVISALFADVQKEDKNGVRTTLKLPVPTRFGYIIHCFDSLLQNKHNLQALAILPKAQAYWKRDPKQIVLGEEFWSLIEKMLTLFRPIGVWISKLESDESKLSLVPEAFYELQQHFQRELEESTLRPLPTAETEKVLSALNKRRDMALRPIHFAANILDPVFKGNHLPEEDSMAGNQLIFELAIKFKLDDDRILAEIAEYMGDGGMWSLEYVRRAIAVTSVVNWWKGICNKTQLSKISVAILNLPPTSAATERSFSTYGWIHSSKRNRLTVKRAGMLTYIAHNLSLQRKKNEGKNRQSRAIVENESDVEQSELDEDFDRSDGGRSEEMEIDAEV